MDNNVFQTNFMKVSIIMPSFLGNYEGAATDREEKFIRAVNSCLDNDYKYKELVIVSDGCEITNNVVMQKFKEQLFLSQIKLVKLPKQPLFSGNVRSAGLANATGNYIMYLDTDDMFSQKHISTVVDQMITEKLDWCYYNDYFNTDAGLVPKSVELEHGSIGTSSIFLKYHSPVSFIPPT